MSNRISHPLPSDALRGLIENAARIVAFTGAGISTECGVPDFRSPDSPWMKHKPIDFQAFMASEAMRAVKSFRIAACMPTTASGSGSYAVLRRASHAAQ